MNSDEIASMIVSNDNSCDVITYVMGCEGNIHWLIASETARQFRSYYLYNYKPVNPIMGIGVENLGLLGDDERGRIV